MKFPIDLLPYLKGEKFSNGLEFRISEPEPSILSRFSYLEKLVAGKNIIHLGCCDHLPLIDDKIRKNIWMHGRLVASAGHCLGIDIEQESVDYVTNKLGYQDILCRNIMTEELPEITSARWDYLVMGEILEHIPDPLSFLQRLHEKFGKNINTLVITVPNAFIWSNHRNLFKHREIINTDHKNTFTPYTLAKALTLAGFTVQEFYFTQEFNFRNWWRKKLRFLYHLRHLRTYLYLRSYPGLRDTIVMTAIF